MVDGQDRTSRIDRLSDKQREVLNLVLDRRTNKEIAHILGISVSGVEQRLQAARQHLGAESRADAARRYEQLIMTCGFTTGGKNQVHFEGIATDDPHRDAAGEPVFALEDSSTLGWPSNWQNDRRTDDILEMLDARFGLVGRIGVIFGLSAMIAILVLTALSIANALDALF